MFFHQTRGVTVFGIGFLIFAIMQLISSYQGSFRSIPIGTEHRRIRLTLGYLITAFIVGLISLLSVFNVLPKFCTNGVGGTLIDQVILSTIIVLFVATSIIFLRQYIATKSTVLYWYTLALAFYAIGTFGLSLQMQFSDIVVWTGRIGLYVATVYFLIALLSSRKNNGRV